MAAKAKKLPLFDPIVPELLDRASADRPGCASCGLFKSCETPFMRPFVPVGWTRRLLLVGEAPGEDEDENSGRPFTGRAGKLLRELYLAAGYTDLDVALVNSVRCRPRENADPTMLSVRACRPFLLRVIGQTNPENVLGLGTIALHALTNSGDGNVTDSRGRELSVPPLQRSGVRITYHPAAVLHGATHLKKRILDDLRALSVAVSEWPKDDLPAGTVVTVDTEYSPSGELLTVGLADTTRATAFEVPELDTPRAWLAAAEYLGGHSVAGDVSQLIAAGLPVREEWARGDKLVDSLLLSRMVDENDLSYELENQLMAIRPTKPWKARTREISETNATLWPTDARVERCRLDAWASACISNHFWSGVAHVPGLVQYTHQIASVLERVSLAGAVVDLDRFTRLKGSYEQQVTRLEDELKKAAAAQGMGEFSPSNDNHIRELLYKHLDLPVTRRTSKQKAGVDKLTLKGLGNEVADKLVEYSKWEKLLSVNGTGLGELLRPCGVIDGRPAGWLPFHINPLGARTGRRASSHPNSQNWPGSVRSIVRSRWPSGLVGDFDYQKLEVVLIAWVAGDDRLFHDFTVGRGYFDVAQALLGREVLKGTPEYRGIKSIVLGVHYNMQTDKMARQLWNGVLDEHGELVMIRFNENYDLHWEEVDRLRQAYLKRYPQLSSYIQEQTSRLLQTQSSLSFTGRVRHLPLIQGTRTPGLGHLINQAINFPIQSLASDVTGSALIDIEAELIAQHGLTYVEYQRALLESRRKILTNSPGGDIMGLNLIPMTVLINEVHDSLVLDFHPDHVKRDTEIVVEGMKAVRSLRELAPGFDLKLGVDFKLGPSWGG